MTRSSLLKLEQCGPVGVEVDIGGRYEITEDAHSMHVRNDQSGAFDESSDAGCVEASQQGISRTPSTIVTGERALGLGELAGKCSGQHGGDTGGDHEADVSAVGEHTGDGSHGRRRVIDELQRTMAAHEVGVGIWVDLEQVCGVALHGLDSLGDPGVASSAIQRGQRVEAGVDDRDVMTELGQWNGQTAGATAKIDDAQGATELLLTLDHDGPHGLPDGRGAQGGLDVAATTASPFISHGKAPLVLVVADGQQA